MPAAKTESLPKSSARAASNRLARLAKQWQRPRLMAAAVVIRPSLRRTLGRFVPPANRIELSPRALAPRVFEEVLTHEAAHAALERERVAQRLKPHGSEWRELMAIAGFARAQAVRWRCRPSAERNSAAPAKSRTAPALHSIIYDHWCPVCQASRPARRPVKAWRCAACSAAGLPGRLEITRRATKARR